MAEATYILMHRDVETVRFAYDLDAHEVSKVLSVPCAAHAPIAIVDVLGRVRTFKLNRWWHERGILASRHHLRSLAGDPGIHSTMTLSEKSFCLCLSDCYWVNDEANPQNWHEINFFDNDFSEDLQLVPMHVDARGSSCLARSLSAHDVEQRKKWVISHGRRLFMKAGGQRFNQVPYNEVVATKLHQRLLQEDDYVSYSLYRDEMGTYCASRCLLGKDEELIPLYDLIRSKRKPAGMNPLAFALARLRMLGAMSTLSTPSRELHLVVQRLRELGIEDPQTFLSKMFTCDYLLANNDRHFCNFGIIRDAKTLEYKRMAPIYDTGTCLWCSAKTLDKPEDFAYRTKPFRPNGMEPGKQLVLVDRYEWFDERALDGFAEEAKAILDQNPLMPPGRTEAIRQGIERNIEQVLAHVARVRRP